MLEDARDSKIEIARGARELALRFRWKASMSNPNRFGTKAEIMATVGLRALPDEEIEARRERTLSAALWNPCRR